MQVSQPPHFASDPSLSPLNIGQPPPHSPFREAPVILTYAQKCSNAAARTFPLDAVLP